MCYEITMNTLDEAKIRHSCVLFLARRGHGGLKELSEASGLTPETIRKVRQGTRVTLDTIVRIKSGLDALGWDAAKNSAKEEPIAYGSHIPGEMTPSARAIIAERLRGVADTLMSQEFTADQKVEEFVTMVNFFLSGAP